MKTESRLFNGVGVFFYLAAAIYVRWSQTSMGRVEWAGTIALVLLATLCVMPGMYFVFIARRIDPRPEDRPDAQIADGAGIVGFFSPGSYWPFGLAAACAIAGLGLALGQWWLLAFGVAAVILAASALLFEYYTGTRRGTG